MASGYGRRIRRSVTGTAVAALAMAALSASQAPGLALAAVSGSMDTATPPPGPAIDGGSPYYTALPPLDTPNPAGSAGAPGTSTGSPTGGIDTSGTGLPATVLDAYKKAQSAIASTTPGCNLRWELLAAIGQVESNQARGGNVDAEGTTITPILGPVLNGNGFANIPDTDHGVYDGDPIHDRAVGPMQFIPQTWATWGADGNGDGVKDPNNVYDAALAAGHYLCAAGSGDLSVNTNLDRAILGYNHSQAYLNLVKSWYEHFIKGGAVSVPNSSGSVTPTSSAGPSASPSVSPSPSASKSRGASASASPSASPSKSPTPTVSASGSISASPSASPSVSPSASPSTSPTTSPTPSPTGTACPTDSPSPSVSPSDSPSPSASPSASSDPCATASPSPSPSGSTTASDSPSAAETLSGKAN